MPHVSLVLSGMFHKYNASTFFCFNWYILQCLMLRWFDWYVLQIHCLIFFFQLICFTMPQVSLVLIGAFYNIIPEVCAQPPEWLEMLYIYMYSSTGTQETT